MESGLQALGGYVQQVLGLLVGDAPVDVEPDFRGIGCRGYTVVHGKRSLGGLEPYHVNTTRNLTWKERAFLYALRARDDVSEELQKDVGISRAAGQKLMHSSSLVVEDASADPVWIHTPARSMQVPAMRWANAAAAIIAEKVQYGPLDTPLWTGRSLAEVELHVPRGHLRFKQHGLSAWTLQRHCRGEIQPPLGEVLRQAPLYVAAATAGLTCRAGVVAHPDGFEIILTDCHNLTREIVVPFNTPPPPTTFGSFAHTRGSFGTSRSHRNLEETPGDTLKTALADALAQWIQEADNEGVSSWDLLWVTPASSSYLLACFEPALRWPPHTDSIVVAAKGEISLLPEAFSAALREAMKEVSRDLSPPRAETGLFEMVDNEGDDSAALKSMRFKGSKSRSNIAHAESAPARSSTIGNIGMGAFEAPLELDLAVMDVAKQRRYIAKVQDALAAELAMAMGVQAEDVIVSSIEEDEHGGWKAIFSANATRNEMESAMAGTQSVFPPPGPDQRVRKLTADVRADKLSKDRRFSMLKHVNPKIPLHEIERVQITDTLAWCHGLGGFTEEDTRRLASIFLSPEALHRKAYSGKGLQAQDFKRLRAAGFTDADLRRLGLLGYGLSDDEVARLEAAGFNKEVLQRRLLSGDAFSNDEQTRLRTEGLPVERLRKLLAGAGKFSMSEKERLMRAGLSEMEVRRRLIGGEDFDEEEVERLEEVELPLYELRRRILQDEIFSTEERLRLGVVGLDEGGIQQRLEDREPFTSDELFSLESAGFDPEELHRRLHGESCFSPSELQRLALIGMTEEEIVRRLLAGDEFSDEELRWLEKGGFTLAKLIRRVFGTSNPTKEDGDLSRSFWLNTTSEEQDRLTNENLAMALQRLMGDTGLLSDEEHYMLESCGLSIDEMQRRLAVGDNFTEEELERLESAGLSTSLHRLASRETISDDERQVLDSCGLPVEEIHRRLMSGEDFTPDEIQRLEAAGFPSLGDLQSAVLADAEQKEEAEKKNEGEVIFKKTVKLKQKVKTMPFASEIATLLKSRYVSEEKLATTTMQSQALERMVIAARNAADDLTDVALADLAKAIAEAIHAETSEEEIEEAQELLQMLRAQYLMQLLETAVESEDMAELAAMLQAVEGKVKSFGLGPPPGADEQTGMVLGFYPRELDPRLPLQGLIQRARAKQEKAMAELKLEDAMHHVAQCPLNNIIQIQQCINMLQDAMHKGEETGASTVLMFAVEELVTDLRGRKARHDDFHAERIAAWHHLQQSCNGLHTSTSSALHERKALQAAFQERSPKVPSGYKAELPVPSCSVSKSLQSSLDHFLELGLNSTDEVQAETENLLELLISVAGLKDFFQLPAASDVFQLNDRQIDLAGLYPNFKELAQAASPPIGPIPALLKDCVRDLQKLLDTWAKLVAEAMPRGLLQAILSGSSDLVAACLYVCVDKAAVFAQVRDEQTGAGAVHVAAAEGHTTIIKVLVENGADPHEITKHGQSALDIAIEALQRQAIDVDLELAGRLQETVDLLHEEYKVISYEYVKYKKRGAWFKRPETMLKWLRIKQLLEHHFDNLKKAFLEIDTNHSGGIVKYEWEAMFGAEGQVKDALTAADLESNDVFGMLDGLDMEGKDMVITKSAFELLDLLDWHLTSEIWQDILLKPLFVRSRRGAVGRHQLPPAPRLQELMVH